MRDQVGLRLLAGALLTAGAALGQTTPASQTPQAAPANLTFDVASVRSAAVIDQATMMAGLRMGRRPEVIRVEGSRATFTYLSLKELIAYGYKVRAYQVTGPEWMVTDRFDVVAKLPEGASRDDVPVMMQALLTERFKLAGHRETKEHPVLGLMIGKGGPKLKPEAAHAPIADDAPLKPGETKIDSIDGPIRVSRNGDGSSIYDMGARGSFTLTIDGQNGTLHLLGDGMTIKGLAYMLTSLGGGGRPVVDMTGLTGTYELAVDFALSDLVSSLRDQGIDIPTGPTAPGSAASDAGGGSTVSDALGKLGLKLEKSKAMVEQLIIDHVEKAATEN
jgi:uncharacterized protein (TIGR03435 family)